MCYPFVNVMMSLVFNILLKKMALDNGKYNIWLLINVNVISRGELMLKLVNKVL